MANARIEKLLNRIELVAVKMKISVEEVMDILESKHPTHVVIQKYKEAEGNDTATAGSGVENPTGGSGPVGASAADPATPAATTAAPSEPVTPSTKSNSATKAQVAAQNKAAAKSAAPSNED